MSYILDALKKAEQGRKQGRAPALFAVQSAELPVVSKPLWPWIAAIALILNGAGLFYWLQKRDAEHGTAQSVISPVDLPQQKQLPAAAIVVASEAMPKPVLPPVEAAPTAVIGAMGTSAKKTENGKATKSMPTEETLAVTLPLAQLPSEIQQAIPKLAVGMHMYSDRPSNRLVSINNRPLHEGDELSAGLKLVEIRSDGVVFSYKGYRFRQGIN
jgi:general secretion pathway protein B